MFDARSSYNSAFPANWTPKQIDDALASWTAQAADIRSDMAANIAAQNQRDAVAKQLEDEKNAALAWCRANGNPHKEQSND